EKAKLQKERDELEADKAKFMQQKRAEEEKLRKEREQLEADKKKFNGDVPEIKEPKFEEPKAKADKDKKPSAEERGYKVNYMDNTISKKYAKETNRLKHLILKMTNNRSYGRSSKNYRKMLKNLKDLDEFMKEINGRTRLTADEMEKYDKLTLKVYNSSKEYLIGKSEQHKEEMGKKKGEEKRALDFGTYTFSPNGEYEEHRIQAAEEVNRSVEQMRKGMFEAQRQEKLGEIRAACVDGLAQEEADRQQLANFNLDNDSLKASLETSVTNTIFYKQRIKQIDEDKAFQFNPGETYNTALMKMEKGDDPTKYDLKETRDHEVTQKMVQEGMDLYKEKKPLTNDDMDAIFKGEAIKKGDEIREENMRKDNMRPISEPNKENKMEKKLEAPVMK
ncbi:MAG: hypothetical protein K6F77_03935, partial [Lachnospiraceae bacterium]|nr:hypothetical protein [Lachnospiraceae bacterium]